MATKKVKKEGRLDIVQALVEAKAKVNKLTEVGVTPIFFAAEKGQAEVVEYLLATNACQFGFQTTVKSLLKIVEDTGPEYWARAKAFITEKALNPDDMYPFYLMKLLV
nr:ankyrin repeat domain-containing protein [Legionella gresilensis]